MLRTQLRTLKLSFRSVNTSMHTYIIREHVYACVYIHTHKYTMERKNIQLSASVYTGTHTYTHARMRKHFYAHVQSHRYAYTLSYPRVDCRTLAFSRLRTRTLQYVHVHTPVRTIFFFNHFGLSYFLETDCACEETLTFGKLHRHKIFTLV